MVTRFLSTWMGSKRSAKATRRLQPFRPRLDALEARSVPSTVNGLVPSQIQQWYAFNQIGFLQGNYDNAGRGQTIAIIDTGTDANILNDANTFSAQWNLPALNVAGGPTLT